ncbi:hypothetical protein F4819DRAFT_506651 [Hypoxylon fuscum]|nr:hypothetical protein F4819DRAFT_506651 [Hypoxylon fuscum]
MAPQPIGIVYRNLNRRNTPIQCTIIDHGTTEPSAADILNAHKRQFGIAVTSPSNSLGSESDDNISRDFNHDFNHYLNYNINLPIFYPEKIHTHTINMSSQITITYGNRTFAPFNTARFMEFLQTHKKEERPPPVDIMQDMYKNLWRPENLNQVEQEEWREAALKYFAPFPHFIAWYKTTGPVDVNNINHLLNDMACHTFFDTSLIRATLQNGLGTLFILYFLTSMSSTSHHG